MSRLLLLLLLLQFVDRAAQIGKQTKTPAALAAVSGKSLDTHTTTKQTA